MKNDPKTKEDFILTLEKINEILPEEIVIPDECGDSLWDKVLEQEESKPSIENQ